MTLLKNKKKLDKKKMEEEQKKQMEEAQKLIKLSEDIFKILLKENLQIWQFKSVHKLLANKMQELITNDVDIREMKDFIKKEPSK